MPFFFALFLAPFFFAGFGAGLGAEGGAVGGASAGVTGVGVETGGVCSIPLSAKGRMAPANKLDRFRQAPVRCAADESTPIGKLLAGVWMAPLRAQDSWGIMAEPECKYAILRTSWGSRQSAQSALEEPVAKGILDRKKEQTSGSISRLTASDMLWYGPGGIQARMGSNPSGPLPPEDLLGRDF